MSVAELGPTGLLQYVQHYAIHFLRGLPNPASLREFTVQLKLSLQGSPSISDWWTVSEGLARSLQSVLQVADQWSSLAAVTFLVELCGCKETRIETVDFSDSVEALKGLGIAVKALIKSHSERDFDWIC
jgi:hypothetical protein